MGAALRPTATTSSSMGRRSQPAGAGTPRRPTGGSWEPTTFAGSLMMRPDFGKVDLDRIYSTSIEEENESSMVNIYPNPASYSVTIRGAENATVQLLSVAGQIVYTENNLSYESTIDVSRFERGIYFLRLTIDDKGTEDFKLIIAR